MPDPVASASRDRLRGVRLLLGLTFRAAPRQAALLVATQIAAQLAWLASMYAVKLLLDAVVRGDIAGATRSAVFMAVAEGASYMCMRMHFIGRELEERASLA